MRVIVLLTLVIGIFRLALEWDRATARRLRRKRVSATEQVTAAAPVQQASARARQPLRVHALHAHERRPTGTD